MCVILCPRVFPCVTVQLGEVGEVQSHLRRLQSQARAAYKPPGPHTLAKFKDEFGDTQSMLHRYARHCRDVGIAPEAFFIRKKLSSTLDLRHFSLGRERAVALSLALASLPLLQVSVWGCVCVVVCV